MGRYATFADAARRVETLKKDGRWPGITCHRDGTFSLTWDPREAVPAGKY